MMKALLATLIFIPTLAFGSPYALELSALCQMQIPDALGNEQSVIEPQGYVYGVADWDGVTTFIPIDSCKQPLTLVPQVNGSPALGSGGVTISLTAAEIAQQNAANAIAQYNALLAGGLTITSTGTSGVSGTYGVQPSDQANFTSAEVAVQSGVAKFPMTWLLANGTPVSIPSSAVFLEIAGATYKFVDAAKLAAAMQSAGQTASWPSASVTVP